MLNVVVLTGRLTRDPELRTTPNGVSVASFTVAVDRGYQKAGTERQADFINCVAWRNTAEFVAKYFEKGRMIGLEGNIQSRSYQDKEGNKRTATEVVANNVHFVDSKPQGGSEYRAPAPSVEEGYQAPSFSVGNSEDFIDVDDSQDDLPF